MTRLNNDENSDVKIQKPIYFLLSQIKDMDEVISQDRWKSRAEMVRTSVDLYMDLRDAYKNGLPDEKVLEVIKDYMVRYVRF